MTSLRRSGLPYALTYIALGSVAVATLTTAACGDDTADISQPSGGSGGEGGGNNPFGGFAAGPQGVGGSAGEGGNGGTGNQGGTGEPTFVWDNVYGDAIGDMAGSNTVHPKDVAIDSNGNIIVVGSFTTTASGADAGVDLGGGMANELNSTGGDDVFVVKYDSAGNWIWSIGAGDSADQSALSVAVDTDDNIWVSGTVKGTFSFPGGTSITNGNNQFPDAWIAKLTSDGTPTFAASYGQDTNYSEFGRALAAGPMGVVAFVGTFQDNIDFGNGAHSAAASADYGMFLARYDNTNAVTLDFVYGDTARQDGYAVAIGVDGSIAIGGASEGNINFGATELTNVSGDPKAVVAKLNGAGQEQFAMLFDSAGTAEVVDLAFHTNGDLLVAGHFTETIDLGMGVLEANGGAKETFVGRFDPSGNPIYAARVGGNGLDDPTSLAVDSNGFSTVVGRFNDNIVVNGDTTLEHTAMRNDAFVVRLGPPGQGYWGFNVQALDDAQATAVAIDPTNDEVIVVGEYTDTIDLGSGQKGGGDRIGMFIARYGSMGD